MHGNSTHEPRLIASGAETEALTPNDLGLWQRIRAEAGHEARRAIIFARWEAAGR